MEIANQTLNEALEGVTNGQIEIAKEVLQKVYDNLQHYRYRLAKCIQTKTFIIIKLKL